MIGFLPLRWQALIWKRRSLSRYGHTSHFRINAIKGFRSTSGLPLKEAARIMDEVWPK